tara:strand:- start:715 stop:957 length:243 start_codon:yes stop_codon:yes gene_type:complete
VVTLVFIIPALNTARAIKFSQIAFWSGHGTEMAALNTRRSVLGITNAGKNLTKLTVGMSESPPLPPRYSVVTTKIGRKYM